jgi:hypothetical protein
MIETQADHSRQQIQVRQDINNLCSDDLRRETMQAQMRLDRVEGALAALGRRLVVTVETT